MTGEALDLFAGDHLPCPRKSTTACPDGDGATVCLCKLEEGHNGAHECARGHTFAARDPASYVKPSRAARRMARNPDRATSVEAGEKFAERDGKLSRLKCEILVVMWRAHPEPMTDSDLGHHAQFANPDAIWWDGEPHQKGAPYGHATVHKRRTDLLQAGYVRAYGEGVSEVGSAMISWVLTQMGIDKAKDLLSGGER